MGTEEIIMGLLEGRIPDKRKNSRIPFLECGKGWYGIVLELLLSVKVYEMENGMEEPSVTFNQIKEKFGSLVIYAQSDDPYVRGLIRAAQFRSLRVCEQCGSTEKVYASTSGWLSRACSGCLEKNPALKKISSEWVLQDDTTLLDKYQKRRHKVLEDRKKISNVLWVDDIRDPRDHGYKGAVWAKTSQEALDMLEKRKWDVISLDHDLGVRSESDGWEIAESLVEKAMDGSINYYPQLYCHSSNPVGRRRIEGFYNDFRRVLRGA